MDNDITLQEGEFLDDIIGEQINVLLNFQDIDFSQLYDDWEADKIRVISLAMKIINARQRQILKELK
jgi:hypothetical protein